MLQSPLAAVEGHFAIITIDASQCSMFNSNCSSSDVLFLFVSWSTSVH